MTNGTDVAGALRHEKWCPRCEAGKPISDFGINRGRKDGLSVYCIQCHRDAHRDHLLRLRREAIAHLGGKCQECGYCADERALQFDHVNSDGKEMRKLSEGRGMAFYKNIATGKLDGKIQLLCANCNQIKVWESKEREGRRVYTREVPTERIDRPNARWTVEQRERQSEKAKAMWADPEKKDQIRENQSKTWDDPAVRAARSRGASENMKRRWDSGEIPTKRGSRRQATD